MMIFYLQMTSVMLIIFGVKLMDNKHRDRIRHKN